MPVQTSTPLRDRLLAEAIEILRRDGGAALTVRRVAAAAGCSTIGVYTHFEGKTGLLDAIIREGFESLEAAVSVVDDLDSGLARLSIGAHAYRDWALRHATQYQVMLGPLVPGFTPGPLAAARGTGSLDAHRARVALAVERGEIDAGDGSAEHLEALTRHVWACVHGHVMVDILMGVEVTDEPAGARFALALGWLLRGLATTSTGGSQDG